MPRVLHIVVTNSFAGVERYTCDVAGETARRGWDVAVVGGHMSRMREALPSDVRWAAGVTVRQSIRSVARLGRWDVCHAQMTAAEAVALATRHFHRAPIVSTRHFAARRGASALGRISAPLIANSVCREIAASAFIARHMERPPSSVVVSGVHRSACLWRRANRVVLVLQRLEPEKDSLTALAAWQLSGLAEEGWSLRVVGDGSQRQMLERFAVTARIPGVTFTGWTADVERELRGAGMMLASAPAEPLGLSVLEAMAAGVPVVACGRAGHLETAGLIGGAPLFEPGDAAGAAASMRALRSDTVRARLSADGRRLVSELFTIERHVDNLLREYEAACDSVTSRRASGLQGR